MAFIVSFDESVISLFVAGSNRGALPVEMFRFLQYRADPEIAAVSVAVILISVAMVVLVEQAVGLRKAVSG